MLLVGDVLPPPDRMTVMWWGLLAQCLQRDKYQQAIPVRPTV